MTQLPPAPPPPEDNPWAAQPPPPGAGYPPGHYPPAAQAVQSVKGLGIATQVMVAIHFVVSIALVFPVLDERSLFRRLKDDPTSVSLSEAEDADRTLNALSITSSLLYLATGIVWIIWFYRARKNVNAWQPHFQRRSDGWAIGGWICPVVNLWFPAMMAKDILDDTDRDPADPNPQRRSRPIVAVWAVGFALMIVTGFAVRITNSRASNSFDGVSGLSDYDEALDAYITLTNVTVASIVVIVLTAVPAVLLVREITAAQERRMQQS